MLTAPAIFLVVCLSLNVSSGAESPLSPSPPDNPEAWVDLARETHRKEVEEKLKAYQGSINGAHQFVPIFLDADDFQDLLQLLELTDARAEIALGFYDEYVDHIQPLNALLAERHAQMFPQNVERTLGVPLPAHRIEQLQAWVRVLCETLRPSRSAIEMLLSDTAVLTTARRSRLLCQAVGVRTLSTPGTRQRKPIPGLPPHVVLLSELPGLTDDEQQRLVTCLEEDDVLFALVESYLLEIDNVVDERLDQTQEMWLLRRAGDGVDTTALQRYRAMEFESWQRQNACNLRHAQRIEGRLRELDAAIADAWARSVRRLRFPSIFRDDAAEVMFQWAVDAGVPETDLHPIASSHRQKRHRLAQARLDAMMSACEARWHAKTTLEEQAAKDAALAMLIEQERNLIQVSIRALEQHIDQSLQADFAARSAEALLHDSLHLQTQELPQ
ncbi:MAG: hypothetical protein ACR2GY_07670 [Phycisphaerales bacterium]